MSTLSLHGVLERPLSELVKVKSRLHSRTQDVGDVRVMGYLPREVANRNWNQPKR